MIPAGPLPIAVGVVGNLCTDLLLRGMRALPAWGEEVDANGHEALPAGQGFHVAAGLAGLGATVRLVGAVGADDDGARIVGALRNAGVETAGVRTHGDAPTALTAVLVRNDGERAFASDFGCQRLLTPEVVLDAWDVIAPCRAVAIVGLLNLPGLGIEAVAPVLRRARAEGKVTVLDTGWDAEGWPPQRVAAVRDLLADVDVFLPNADEARILTGHDDPEAAARDLARAGAGTVLVKCGAAGVVGVAGTTVRRVGALDVTVHDAVGAGDTFDAGFIVAHLHGLPLVEAMAFASAGAGIFVSRATDRRPTYAEAAHRARVLLAPSA